MKAESSTVTVSDITLVKFNELYSKHKETLSCPCSKISMPYKTFVSNTIKHHPVCKSIFVNQSWIEALYLLNASQYGVWDFRTTASFQFALLSDFCSITQDAIFQIENDVGNNDFITTYLLTDTQIHFEVNSTTESFKNSASARIIMFLNYLRTTVRENYLVSALNTNLITGISSNSNNMIHVAAFPVYYKSASGNSVSCNQGNPTSAATLNPLLNGSLTVNRIPRFESMPNSTIVSGFFAACTPLEALLQSTLDCLYENECLQLLSNYFPALNHMGVNWTDFLLTSKQQNLSVSDYFNNLFIEEWLTNINYSKYFNECHPSACTYTATDRAAFTYAITLFISLYGGLVIILRLSASLLVNVSLKFKYRPRNIRMHFGSIIVLLLFTSLNTQTATVTIPNPSLDMYKNLQTLHSTTPNCPCSTKTISYRSFVSLSPVLHQVCSSGFVTDDWVALLKRSTTKEQPNDWRNRAGAQFQLLSDFCRLANKTIDDSIDRFLKKFFIASTVFNEIDFNTQLNSSERRCTSFVASRSALYGIATDGKLKLVLFTLPSIPESNSTVLTCICATNPHCRALNIIYTQTSIHGIYVSYVMPSSIRGCLNSDSLLLSTLQCLYADSDCFLILLSHFKKFYSSSELKLSLHDISPLINDPTRSRFPPNTLVSTIFKEMMVEQWSESSSYKNFYESCAPIHCTYSEKIRTKTIEGIMLALMSVIGGLVVSLRLITPYLVRFFYHLWEKINKRQQNQQQDEQVHGNCCDRFKVTMRNVIKLLYTTLINLNIFSLSDIGSNVDPIKAKRLGRWATRLYIALFIGGLSILTVYNVIQPQMMTKTFDKPSFNVYNDLKKLYGDELKCPCSVIASVYSRFIEIDPIFHHICSSPFASEQWRINLTAGLAANLSIYTRRDYRRFLSAHLQFLQGLCQLSMNAADNSVNQFLTSLLVTSELLSEINFHQKLESLIEQSKSNAPTTFRHLLFLIQTINHGNAFMSTYGTTFEYIVPKNASTESYLSTTALIYDDECSCGLYSNCTTQANFITFNSSRIIPIPIKGLKIGCTPSESLRASTLECFYDSSCINLIHEYTNYNNSHDPLSTMKSRVSINTTIAELIDNLFIEQWSTKMNYTSYFQQCLPSYCYYISTQKFNFLDIITLLLSLQGGLAIVLKWICPKIVRIASKIKDYRKKRVNTVNPGRALEETSDDISNTPVDNVTTNLETSSTPETSPTITGRSVRRTSKIFFGCILLTSVIAALIISSFYIVRQASSINMTNDTNLNPTTNTTMSTFSSTATPICQLEFRSISMNTSNVYLDAHAFVFADFNNDNRLDLVFYSEFYTTLNLLFGDGYGNFGAKNIIPMKSFISLSHIDVGDFNNDNHSDLVLVNHTHIGILFGNGNGAFGAVIRFELGEKCTPVDITVADFNHDNYSDIAVVSLSNNNICVFLKSNDNFSSPFIFSTGHNSQPRALNVGDFNNDGHLDIAVTNNNAVNVGVFIGCGNGTFEVQKQSFNFFGSDPNNLAVGDFDGDTHPDIVISNREDNIVCILSGYSNGSFGIRQKFFIKSALKTPSVAVGDFNCDGHLDIAVGTTGRCVIDALVGYGDGHFETQTICSNHQTDNDIRITVHDFNADTFQDIAVIYLRTDTIDILLNVCECCMSKILKKSNSSLQ
ncbi:unnamed protein product [Adineta steineri]|uniref:Uncharacterized protein n=1 Tax=Adineta steineri TaxID=433720 RepID=A0A813P277_9BILA|nr:unnamed protein product [Adineta steineri]CAF1058961.1 unnamed protein product [Adineta steineri]